MIPPLVSFPNFETFSQSLRHHYTRGTKSLSFPERVDRIIDEAQRLFGVGLPPAPNPTSLAVLLGVSPQLITSMALRQAKYWRTFNLPKRSGGVREITAPRIFLKTIQYYLLQNALGQIEDAEESYGFTKRKSIFKNAAVHLGRKFIWNTDIEDFFPTIGHGRVRHAFRSLGYDLNMSNVLASLCTYKGRLAQGAPTSPKLSNIVFHQVDRELVQLATTYGSAYSRYADDLTFSSDEPPAPDFVERCDQILTQAGFRRNKEKTRLHRPNEAKYVTGLLVNEKVQPSRETRRRLRATFHHLEKSGGLSPGEMNRLQGWAAYVHAYDPELGRSYLSIVRSNSAQRTTASESSSQISET